MKSAHHREGGPQNMLEELSQLEVPPPPVYLLCLFDAVLNSLLLRTTLSPESVIQGPGLLYIPGLTY